MQKQHGKRGHLQFPTVHLANRRQSFRTPCRRYVRGSTVCSCLTSPKQLLPGHRAITLSPPGTTSTLQGYGTQARTYPGMGLARYVLESPRQVLVPHVREISPSPSGCGSRRLWERAGNLGFVARQPGILPDATAEFRATGVGPEGGSSSRMLSLTHDFLGSHISAF